MLGSLVQKLLFRVWLLKRGMTLGVRAVLLDAEDRVLLVRHGYTPGWHFPGGGVEAGETLQHALQRECLEETGMALREDGVLHGIFHNRHAYRRDHVAVFIIRKFEKTREVKPNMEIQEMKFFSLAALPGAITPGTRQRLHEIIDDAAVIPTWS